MGGNKRVYRAKARTWGLGESSTGKEQVAVEFEVLTPDAAEHVLTWYGYFTDATWERTVESLRHCGWQGDDLTQLEDLDANEVDLVVEDEEYEGKAYPRVQWVNRAGGLAIKTPLAGDKAKAFAAGMKDRIRALAASSGQPRPQRQARPAGARQGSPASGPIGPEPPPITEEDLGF